MKTGIEFFDKQKPEPGSLWIVLGQAGGGKSVLLRNLSLGLTKHLRVDGNTAASHFWSGEEPYAVWGQKMLLLDPEFESLKIEFNLDTWPSLRSPGEGLAERLSGAAVVAIDQLDLIVGAGYSIDLLDQALMHLRLHAARNGCLTIVSLQIPYSDHLSTMSVSAIVNSLRSPYWLGHASTVLVPISSGWGELEVRVLKGIGGVGQDASGRFKINREGQLVPIQ